LVDLFEHMMMHPKQ